MKLKVGMEVQTPYGVGLIRKVAYDRKFDINYYFVDIPRTVRMAQITKVKFDTMKFWDYQVKNIREA